MSYVTKSITLVSFCIILASAFSYCRSLEQKTKADQVLSPMKLYVIVGSVRPTGTGKKIAENVKSMINHRSETTVEIVEIVDYNLPFYTNEQSPASRKDPITDPILKRWSDKIEQADGYIIVSPEYNAGYPASLKNALDSLFTEWNNKPIAFVGYSGGQSGGASTIAQLRQVARYGLEMIPVATDVKIPQSWKAFDRHGKLVHAEAIEAELNILVDQLLEARSVAKKQ